MMEMMHISHLANKSYLEISGGERQLALISQALTQQPDYLILDEPTAHLDFGNQIRILKILQKLASEGYGVIISTHFPDHLLMFSLIVGLIYQGKLVNIGPAECVITSEMMGKIYDLNVDISMHPVLQAAGLFAELSQLAFIFPGRRSYITTKYIQRNTIQAMAVQNYIGINFRGDDIFILAKSCGIQMIISNFLHRNIVLLGISFYSAIHPHFGLKVNIQL